MNSSLETRITSAERYHKFLSRNFQESWLDLFEECENNEEFGLPEIMVLIHPNWYEELQISKHGDPRGNSTFSSASINAKCRSSEIWGYECPYIQINIHIDHTFPYSRGGATKSDNAMYLCKEHNLSKSTDLHLIPWETFPSKIWIKEELNTVLNFAKSFYNRELYFPDKQLRKI